MEFAFRPTIAGFTNDGFPGLFPELPFTSNPLPVCNNGKGASRNGYIQ